ncbi:MAG: hypothetical protein ACREQJ_01540, partial [Candidatus Binatia bacterium]
MSLTLAERVVAAVCIVYPFRLMLNAVAGMDLHLGIVSFVIVGLVALKEVRELPPGFPNPLDVAIAAFGVLLVADLFLLTGPTGQAVKGMSVELRLVAFYFAARALRLRREFAVWLLTA